MLRGIQRARKQTVCVTENQIRTLPDLHDQQDEVGD
jgi:hypothetical protein